MASNEIYNFIRSTKDVINTMEFGSSRKRDENGKLVVDVDKLVKLIQESDATSRAVYAAGMFYEASGTWVFDMPSTREAIATYERLNPIQEAGKLIRCELMVRYTVDSTTVDRGYYIRDVEETIRWGFRPQ